MVLKVHLLLMISLSVVGSVLAQPSVSPELIARFNSMSPEEQRALAQQYGASIQDLRAITQQGSQKVSTNPGLGSASKTLKPQEIAREVTLAGDQLASPEKPSEVKESPTARDPKLPRFGSQIFDSSITRFTQVDNLPVPSGYVLGVGDQLSVLLYGNDNVETSVVIDREGAVNFPLLGPLVLAGISWNEAKDLVERRVQDQLVGTKVVVSLGRLRSINVFMAGEVTQPGNFTVSALTTIIQSIYLAGGITDKGSYRDIQVIRDGQKVASLDLYELLLEGSVSSDERLQNGDVVFVPLSESIATIRGAVNRPARFETIEGETLGDLINMAGGLTPEAITQQAVLQRRDLELELPVLNNLDLTDAGVLRLPIQDGDLVAVGSLPNRIENPITLSGAVTQKGLVAWEPGLRLSSFIKNSDKDLEPAVDFEIGLIARRVNQKLDIEVLSFQLSDVLLAPGESGDPLLKPYDEVYVFGPEYTRSADLAGVVARLDRQATYSNWSQTVTLKGAVSGGGRFPLPMGDFHVTDLLLLSGGGTNVANDVELDIGLIVRRANDRFRVEAIPFNLGKALSEPHGAEDPVLSPLDEVLIFNDASAAGASNRRELMADLVNRFVQQANPEEPPQLVTIQGRVREPGTYPILASNDLAYLISLAGGFEEGAYQRSVELRRRALGSDGEIVVEIQEVNLASSNSLSTRLQSRDVVRVNTIPNWTSLETVAIEGEVRFPGEYVISPGEQLSSLVARAGGLTDSAYLKGAVFKSAIARELQLVQARRYFSSLSAEQSKSVGELTIQTDDSGLENTTLIESITGRISIDLEAILNGGAAFDPILVDGDQLIVPKQPYSVNVFGEVFEQGAHAYDTKLTVNDYLKLAGGETRFADSSRTYIIKANGEVKPIRGGNWLFGRSAKKIEAGDSIVVPLNQNYEKPLTRAQSVTSVVFQSMASIAAFFAIKNN